mgnify:CR=1 FL=1
MGNKKGKVILALINVYNDETVLKGASKEIESKKKSIELGNLKDYDPVEINEKSANQELYNRHEFHQL